MLLKSLSNGLSTLGVGHLPKAPGTWGSLLAIIIWWAIMPQSIGLQAVLILLAFFVGWPATYYYEKLHNRHDPKEVVVDELIGMWLTLIAAPKALGIYVLGFLFFRFFDIKKPFPIGWIDKNTNSALGTILDDVVAGIFAFLVLQASLYIYTLL